GWADHRRPAGHGQDRRQRQVPPVQGREAREIATESTEEARTHENGVRASRAPGDTFLCAGRVSEQLAPGLLPNPSVDTDSELPLFGLDLAVGLVAVPTIDRSSDCTLDILDRRAVLGPIARVVALEAQPLG